MTKSHARNPQVLLFFGCFAAYVCAYLSRDTFSAVMPNILSQTEITKTEIGTISTVFLIFYGCGQLISGFLGDKIRSDKLIAMGLLLSAISNSLIGSVDTMIPMAVLWGLNGLALSFLWPPIIKIITVYMDDDYRLKALVNISISMPVGTLIAFGLSAFIVDRFNYRYSFVINGIIIAGCLVGWLLVSRSAMKSLSFRLTANSEAQANEPSRVQSKQNNSLISIFIVSGLFFIIVAVMFNGIVRNGVSIWIPTYLTEYFEIEESVSILTSVLIPIINLPGIYVAAHVNKKTKNEMITAGIFFITALIPLVLLMFVGGISPFVSVVFFGLTTSSMQGLTAVVMSFVPTHFKKSGRISTVTGILNSSAYLAASIGSFTVGVLSSRYGWDMTVVFWVSICGGGVLICAIVAKRWKKFISMPAD